MVKVSQILLNFFKFHPMTSHYVGSKYFSVAGTFLYRRVDFLNYPFSETMWRGKFD